MSDPFGDRPFPTWTLWAAGSLIGLTLALIVWNNATGADEGPVASVPVIESRDLVFVDQADGSVLVKDNGTDEVIEVVAPGADGFLRASLRSLARLRRVEQAALDLPFELTLYADGQLILVDTATEERVNLRAFGPTNAGAFERLLEHTQQTKEARIQ